MAARNLLFSHKVHLLNRAVLSCVRWKFSAWPYQKAIAVELDQLQSRMLGIISRVCRRPYEDLLDYFKRRQHIGRKLAGDLGFWSAEWMKRSLSWHEHVVRGNSYDYPLFNLFSYHDKNWLIQNRLRFVPSDGTPFSRNTPRAGRLGTRAIGSRPKPRWEEGIDLIKELGKHANSTPNSESVSIGTRIQRAHSYLIEFFALPS